MSLPITPQLPRPRLGLRCLLLPHQPPQVGVTRASQHAIQGEALPRVRLIHRIVLQFLLALAQDTESAGRRPGPGCRVQIVFGHIQSLPVLNASDDNMGMRMRSIVVIRGHPLHWPGQVPFHLADKLFNKGGAWSPNGSSFVLTIRWN